MQPNTLNEFEILCQLDVVLETLQTTYKTPKARRNNSMIIIDELISRLGNSDKSRCTSFVQKGTSKPSFVEMEDPVNFIELIETKSHTNYLSESRQIERDNSE